MGLSKKEMIVLQFEKLQGYNSSQNLVRTSPQDPIKSQNMVRSSPRVLIWSGGTALPSGFRQGILTF